MMRVLKRGVPPARALTSVGPKTLPWGRLSRGRTAAATVCLAAVAAIVVGALGPWVEVGTIFTADGWPGLGLPLIMLAGVAMAVVVLALVTGRQRLFGLVGLIGGVMLAGAGLVLLLVGALSGPGNLIALVLAPRLHAAQLQGQTVSAGLGLHCVLAAATVLTIAAIAAVLSPELRRTAADDPAIVPSPSGPALLPRTEHVTPTPPSSVVTRPTDSETPTWRWR